MNVPTIIEKLKASARNQDLLVAQAFRDCIEELARFAVHDRPPRETIRLLSSWRDTFANLDRSRRRTARIAR
jgi:hypothetical protein